ncbi:MAG: MFS transporter [Parvibaculum sp.]|nr:MFS transporter [Parvibaculum sp.]
MNKATSVSNGAKKLSVGNYLGYGVGDLAVNLFFQSAILYLLIFYTDIVGISPAVAASIFLVARVVDAVTDPLMGVIADKTRTRWGKFRPYLIYGSVPLSLMAIATFSAPFSDDSSKILFAYATYIVFGIAYTVVSIPYSGLTAVITDDAQERTMLSAYRMAFALGGGLVVGVGTLPLVEALGGGAQGYQLTLSLYGVLAVLLLLVTFLSTRERVAATAPQTPRLVDCLSVLAHNPPLWLITTAFFMGMLAFIIRSTAIIYYFQYNLGQKELFPIFMLSILLGQLAGIVVTPMVAKKLGKKNTYIWGALGGMATGVVLFMTPYEAITAIFVVSILGSFFFAFPTVMGWSMLPDTIEYAEWKKGIRADGAIYAVSSFFQKMAMAVGGALAAMILSVTGYVANQPQNADALHGILLMISLVPVAIMVIGIAAIWFYQLDDDTHATIRGELDERRLKNA